MDKFEIGDWVYADDWLYGQIVELFDDGARVEFDTGHGGGNMFVSYEFMRLAEENG